MTNRDKAEEIIKKLAEVAYLAIGKELGENIKGKKVYLSGPITYCRNYKGLFLFAEKLARMCDAARIFNPASQIPDSLSHEQAMKRCVAALAEYDTIMLLPRWPVSEGAKIEHDIALACGMSVIDLTKCRYTHNLFNTVCVVLTGLL
ncbi:MAG: DUF4406 domain-containing protein [Atopobium sp.]|nr:DUF4406 domain-containing protein [Atopobium sp.]